MQRVSKKQTHMLTSPPSLLAGRLGSIHSGLCLLLMDLLCSHSQLRRREVSGHSTSLGFWVLPWPAVLTAAALSSLGCCPKREGREVVSPALAGWLRGGRS